MKKDIEWLKKEIEEYLAYEGVRYARIALESVLGYINQLDEPDEPEKPVIPQFVADWIDTHNLYGNNPLCEYRDLENDFNEGWTDEKDATVYHWVNRNPYAFIDALRYGYEVEKEKKYYIYDKSTKGYLGYNADKTRLSWYTSSFPNDVFTEQEIKAIDERYWAFAEEITE
jgi:hypothetical protein